MSNSKIHRHLNVSEKMLSFSNTFFTHYFVHKLLLSKLDGIRSKIPQGKSIVVGDFNVFTDEIGKPTSWQIHMISRKLLENQRIFLEIPPTVAIHFTFA